MPTQRFLNLKESKRKVILDAAVKEFSRVPYSAASINQIIKEAEISRGSFYTYFEDKDDLIRYILGDFSQKFEEKILGLLEEEGESPFSVCLRLLKERLEMGAEGPGYRMYQNLIGDMNTVDQGRLFGIQEFMLKDPAYLRFVDHVCKILEKRGVQAQPEILAYGIDLLLMVGIKALTMYYRNPEEKEEILRVTEQEIRILEKGLCR